MNFAIIETTSTPFGMGIDDTPATFPQAMMVHYGFEYASRLTETMLLGLVALRVGQGRKILYDGANARISNVPDANFLLTRDYRAGWSV